MSIRWVSRREVIRWLGAASAVAALPGGCADERLNPAPAPFLTQEERLALGALADAVLPPDDTPGGAALGAVPYVERLLTAFDVDPPAIFAGGPYSGRGPDAGGAGVANDFARFEPLDRVSEAAMRLWLYGSSGVPGGGPNDAALGPVVGLRDKVRTGLAGAIAAAPGPIESLDAQQLRVLLTTIDTDFVDLMVELVTEAAFAAPEYGGNPDLAGWKLAHFEGDQMPLGYSIFDEAIGAYRERPEAPVSTTNLGRDPMPMDDDTRELLRTVVGLAGGKEFT